MIEFKLPDNAKTMAVVAAFETVDKIAQENPEFDLKVVDIALRDAHTVKTTVCHRDHRSLAMNRFGAIYKDLSSRLSSYDDWLQHHATGYTDAPSAPPAKPRAPRPPPARAPKPPSVETSRGGGAKTGVQAEQDRLAGASTID